MKLQKILLMLLFVSFTCFAQDDMKEKRNQIKQLKVTFYNSELNLTGTEAEKFWPIYNSYDDKQFEIRHKKQKTYRNQMKGNLLDKMTEKEASVLLRQIETTDEELYQLRKNLMSNLKRFLPNVKILKLKRAEEDFSRKLLQQYKEKNSKK
ncbi:sensor of ECF-type sigma factor [Flavobacterium algicola]|uniref:sensor of ECF-type sigma factor n=1 Tax=Flavobacterium algicola TaxID=556529 RepID=UPI001EFD60EC|nr:sensor of ECF-type sigma factor [Flavobacterium algicola]MCG9793037.1 sensor of ECF-type sigma factor [Flavobacterium algicola]